MFKALSKYYENLEVTQELTACPLNADPGLPFWLTFSWPDYFSVWKGQALTYGSTSSADINNLVLVE